MEPIVRIRRILAAALQRLVRAVDRHVVEWIPFPEDLHQQSLTTSDNGLASRIDVVDWHLSRCASLT
jgi:hypothetical protein